MTIVIVVLAEVFLVVVACGLLVGLSGLWMALFYPRAAGP